MYDYSQYGQGLLLPQLVMPDTPRTLVDIGAHDGVTGSNSRNLLETGWHGVLVEPLPAAFERLRVLSQSLASCALINAAVSNHDGYAYMRLGQGGELSQMASLSSDPEVARNLEDRSIEVSTISLASLFRAHNIPEDFGALLLDSEGLDLIILHQLASLTQRPRIIVSEDMASTDHEKYALLNSLGYRFLGIFGCDSFWISNRQAVDTSQLRLPVHRLPAEWRPSGKRVSGTVNCDRFLRPTILGWGFLEREEMPPPAAAIALLRVGFPARYVFRAHRYVRDDVGVAFGSPVLSWGGIRAFIDVFPGEYHVTIYQMTGETYSENEAGRICIPE